MGIGTLAVERTRLEPVKGTGRARLVTTTWSDATTTLAFWAQLVFYVATAVGVVCALSAVVTSATLLASVPVSISATSVVDMYPTARLAVGTLIDSYNRVFVPMTAFTLGTLFRIPVTVYNIGMNLVSVAVSDLIRVLIPNEVLARIYMEYYGAPIDARAAEALYEDLRLGAADLGFFAAVVSAAEFQRIVDAVVTIVDILGCVFFTVAGTLFTLILKNAEAAMILFKLLVCIVPVVARFILTIAIAMVHMVIKTLRSVLKVLVDVIVAPIFNILMVPIKWIIETLVTFLYTLRSGITIILKPFEKVFDVISSIIRRVNRVLSKLHLGTLGKLGEKAPSLIKTTIAGKGLSDKQFVDKIVNIIRYIPELAKLPGLDLIEEALQGVLDLLDTVAHATCEDPGAAMREGLGIIPDIYFTVTIPDFIAAMFRRESMDLFTVDIKLRKELLKLLQTKSSTTSASGTAYNPSARDVHARYAVPQYRLTQDQVIANTRSVLRERVGALRRSGLVSALGLTAGTPGLIESMLPVRECTNTSSPFTCTPMSPFYTGRLARIYDEKVHGSRHARGPALARSLVPPRTARDAVPATGSEVSGADPRARNVYDPVAAALRRVPRCASTAGASGHVGAREEYVPECKWVWENFTLPLTPEGIVPEFAFAPQLQAVLASVWVFTRSFPYINPEWVPFKMPELSREFPSSCEPFGYTRLSRVQGRTGGLIGVSEWVLSALQNARLSLLDMAVPSAVNVSSDAWTSFVHTFPMRLLNGALYAAERSKVARYTGLRESLVIIRAAIFAPPPSLPCGIRDPATRALISTRRSSVCAYMHAPQAGVVLIFASFVVSVIVPVTLFLASILIVLLFVTIAHTGPLWATATAGTSTAVRFAVGLGSAALALGVLLMTQHVLPGAVAILATLAAFNVSVSLCVVLVACWESVCIGLERMFAYQSGRPDPYERKIPGLPSPDEFQPGSVMETVLTALYLREQAMLRGEAPRPEVAAPAVRKEAPAERSSAIIF